MNAPIYGLVRARMALQDIAILKIGSFPFVPPSLVGAYYLYPPDARAIFLHSNLLCNGTCSVTAGRITYWGAQTEKILQILCMRPVIRNFQSLLCAVCELFVCTV